MTGGPAPAARLADYLVTTLDQCLAVRIPADLIAMDVDARGFRALAVYVNLVAYGRTGYEDMLVRQTRLARGIASYVWDQPAYELLPRQRDRQDVRTGDSLGGETGGSVCHCQLGHRFGGTWLLSLRSFDL